jgi:hypothetical protein
LIAMPDEQRNLEVVGEIGVRWNAGDHEGVLDLYHEDIVMTASSRSASGSRAGCPAGPGARSRS